MDGTGGLPGRDGPQRSEDVHSLVVPDGTTHLLFDPVELLERLAALIRRPRINLLLYHGVLAPRAAWRSLVVQVGARPVFASASKCVL